MASETEAAAAGEGRCGFGQLQPAFVSSLRRERFPFAASRIYWRGGKRKCPVLISSVVNDNGRPADRIAHVTKALFAKVQLLQQLVIFRQIMPFEIIEELATA